MVAATYEVELGLGHLIDKARTSPKAYFAVDATRICVGQKKAFLGAGEGDIG